VDKNQFNVRFFHLIFEEEIGSIQGHFGPVNVLSFSPEGDGYLYNALCLFSLVFQAVEKMVIFGYIILTRVTLHEPMGKASIVHTLSELLL
jgi:hypothetical protein